MILLNLKPFIYIKFFIIISAAYCKQFKQPVIELDLDNDRLLNYLSYIEY